MREILFRGKRTDNGEWVEGYFYKTTYFGADDGICAFIAVPHPENPNKSSDHIMVDPKTVGQYTGLTNKNGKKIFEGDIVKWYSDYDDTWGYSHTAEYYGVVVWSANDYCWNIKVNDELITFNDYDWDISMVIGNIHDNPDSLKGGAEE